MTIINPAIKRSSLLVFGRMIGAGDISILEVILVIVLVSVRPQTASFGPERRFRSFEILKIARYASGFKIAQALL